MKDTKTNWSPLILGSVIAIVAVLGADYFWGDDFSFIRHLTQGEVLTGIAVAAPAFVTWNMSVLERRNSEKEQRENEKKALENERNRIAQQALEIVKHYDEQLYEVTTSISKDGLDARKASKVVYIINTFDKLFKEINAEERTAIYLDFSQILTTVCSIKYPDKLIENPRDSRVSEWKENVANCLYPALVGIINKGENDILRSRSIKYFSFINFGKAEINISSMEFKNKSFVECTFTKEFIEENTFENCEFIDCSFEE